MTSFTSHVLPEAQLLIGGLCGARVIRTKHLVADGDDSLALIVNRSGVLGISERGHDLSLRAGEAVLTSAESNGGTEALLNELYGMYSWSRTFSSPTEPFGCFSRRQRGS